MHHTADYMNRKLKQLLVCCLLAEQHGSIIDMGKGGYLSRKIILVTRPTTYGDVLLWVVSHKSCFRSGYQVQG